MRKVITSANGTAVGSRRLGVTVAAAVLAAATTLSGAMAREEGRKPAPSNPVGAGWNSTVKAAPGTSAATFDERQIAIIKAVNGYFSGLTTLSGTFVQIDPDKKSSRGKFFVKKPGQFRFDYARPSRKVIVSDGRFLAMEDFDLGTSDTFELDNTPFRILLRTDVDLLRDSKILEAVDVGGTSVVVTVQDKNPDAPGSIRLFMAATSDLTLELQGWITYDAQGLETRIDVADLEKGKPLSGDLFKRENFTMRKMNRN